MVNGLTDYRSAIDALFARTTAGTKFGLERTEELLDSLDNPHRKFASIHVAGTNGKGSVVAACDAVLREKGLRVGRYTSPHLVDFRERILVGGSPITEREVLRFLERTTALSERIGATFFELTTAMAFDHFARARVDVAVIETGLGGRLDSTNVLVPQVATVTAIGLDHTEILGSTLDDIAREKAGIFKEGITAVIGQQDARIAGLLRDEALARGASSVISVGEAYDISDVSVVATGTSFSLRTDGSARRLVISLIGEHQARNATTAVATLLALPETLMPDWNEMEHGFAHVRLPGRFQRHGRYIFDVAHNPAAADVLARNIQLLSPPHPRTALLAVLADKDWRGVIRSLSTCVDRFVMAVPPSAPGERTWDPVAAVEFAESIGAAAALRPEFESALETAGVGAATVVVTGSFHTVGDAMSRLQVSPFEP